MANPTNFPGDIFVPGNIRLGGTFSPGVTRASVLALSALEPFVIPWTWWRVWNSYTTNLPDTAASDDLALIQGTFGSASPSIQSADFGGNAAYEAFARVTIPLPWSYEDAESVTLRFHAGMLTTVASVSCTLDVECYETDEEAGISADLCATAAKNINSLSLADQDFTITPTAIVAGDLLDVRITVAGNDALDAGVMKAIIGAAKLLCDVR